MILNEPSGRTLARRSWGAMLKRCRSVDYHAFHRYGGRGITVCERWQSFENFLADMGERSKGMSLGRVNNDGNYEPGNCRWESFREQCSNKHTTRLITANGKTLPMCEWSRLTGLKAPTICRRLNAYGWSEQDAVTVPLMLSPRGPRKRANGRFA